MIKHIRAIFPDQNPLSPKIIECYAEINDETGRIENWRFSPSTPIEDIMFFLEFTSNPACEMISLGEEKI